MEKTPAYQKPVKNVKEGIVASTILWSKSFKNTMLTQRF